MLIFGAMAAISLSGPTTQASSRSAADSFSGSTPLCTVLENARSHVGQHLLIRGDLVQTPEGREFVDDGCERGFLPLKPLPETPRARRLREQFDHYTARSDRRPPQVTVVYSGIFTDHTPALVCDGACSSYSLEAAELVAVRPK